MKLAHERIADLAAREGAKSEVVENFLCTLSGLSRNEALANLELDARLYHWSTATGRAIQQGIMEATEE